MNFTISPGRRSAASPDRKPAASPDRKPAASPDRKPAADRCRPWLVSAFAAAACLAIAACGLQKGTNLGCSNGSSRAPTGAKTAAGDDARICAYPAVRVLLDIRAARSAAASAILPVDVTNVSATTCRLASVPVVTLMAARDGSQVGSAVIAEGTLVARTFDLPAGRTAHLWLRLMESPSRDTDGRPGVR
jgi:hypothetical protein